MLIPFFSVPRATKKDYFFKLGIGVPRLKIGRFSPFSMASLIMMIFGITQYLVEAFEISRASL